MDYTDVNPTWGKKLYNKEEFARLWLSEEHLGNSALNTQHLLGLPFFSYVGPKRLSTSDSEDSSAAKPVSHGNESAQDRHPDEIEVSWQVLASHGRRGAAASTSAVESDNKRHLPHISETSDHRAFMTHVYLRLQDGDQMEGGGWKLTSIKPSPIYATGDFERVRRASDAP